MNFTLPGKSLFSSPKPVPLPPAPPPLPTTADPSVKKAKDAARIAAGARRGLIGTNKTARLGLDEEGRALGAPNVKRQSLVAA